MPHRSVPPRHVRRGSRNNDSLTMLPSQDGVFATASNEPFFFSFLLVDASTSRGRVGKIPNVWV